MSGTWFCLDCGYDMGMDKDVCPCCGYPKYGKNNEYAPDAKSYAMARKALYGENSKSKEPTYTDEERLALGLHPKDEGYKMSLISRILGKK